MAAACARQGQAAARARSVASERLAAAEPVQQAGVSEDGPVRAVRARAPEDEPVAAVQVPVLEGEPVSAVQAPVLEGEPVAAMQARAPGAEPAAAMQARPLEDEAVLVVSLAGRLGVVASVRGACRAARPFCPSQLPLVSGPAKPRSRHRRVGPKPESRPRA